MAKHKDLQPWLDYFDMLHTYEENGFLLMKPDEHEAYVTQPALYTLSARVARIAVTPDNAELLQQQLASDMPCILRRLRAYAGWKSTQGRGYLSLPFSLHMIMPDAPYDPICTFLMTRRRRWWWPLRKLDCIEIIPYKD